MAWGFATLLLIASLAATVVAVRRRSVRKDAWLPCGEQYPSPALVSARGTCVRPSLTCGHLLHSGGLDQVQITRQPSPF
jgi:hypothetical protein